MEDVLISRLNRAIVNGKPAPPERVYVTGPHFGRDVFSSTSNPDEASRFKRDEAHLTIRRCSSWQDARVEELS